MVVAKSRCVVVGKRVGTSPVSEGIIFQPRVPHDCWEPDVSFDAARLVINPVLLIALLCELLLHRPWPCPHRRILDGDLICERPWAGPRPALNQVQILSRTPVIGFGAEVRHIDDERIAVPVPP